jgi:hypothetical protein
MQNTTNYEFRKPEDNEVIDIDDLNYNADQIDSALTPTADPTQAPASSGPHKLVSWVSYFANRIKAITGKTNWYDAPSKTLEDVNAHLADTMPHITYVPQKTTADITLYVDTANGNDANDGLAAGVGHALKTITAAIAKIPQVVNHAVTVNVAAGDYSSEAIDLRGYIGRGSIIFQGASNVADSANYLANRILSLFNIVPTSFKGFRVTYANNYALYASSSAQVLFQNCSMVVSATGYYGAVCAYGSAVLDTCEISNRAQAAAAMGGGNLHCNALTGTGNTTALYAIYGGILSKKSTTGWTITGSVVTSYGGIIVLPSGATLGS